MKELFPPLNSEYKKRVAMVVEYDGSAFNGWQIQKNTDRTVQHVVTEAVSKIANHPVKLYCAGRTDTGVHGSRQIIHFDTKSSRNDYGWMSGTNTHLPPTVRIQGAKETSLYFHARFSAQERRYRYVVYNHPVAPGLLRHHLTWFRYPLDAECMDEAAQLLKGKHDFSTFRAADCQAHSPEKTISSISVKQYGKMIVLDIQADGFLYHMVRNIMGVLLEIGQKRKPVSWVSDLIALKNRHKGGVTAEASGLYFVDAIYDDAFGIPETPPGPNFLNFLIEES